MLTHWQHLGNLARQKTIHWGKSQVIGFLIAMAINLLEVAFGLIPTQATWKASLVVIFPYLVVLLFVYLYQLAKVVWEDHRDQALTISDREQKIKEVNTRLSVEIAQHKQWRESGKLDALAQEAGSLHAQLEHMLSISRTNRHCPPELLHPFSEAIYQINPLSWNGFAVNIWKLQEDIKTHRRHMASQIPSLQTPLVNLLWPSKIEAKEALALLETHHQKVSAYLTSFINDLSFKEMPDNRRTAMRSVAGSESI